MLREVLTTNDDGAATVLLVTFVLLGPFLSLGSFGSLI